MAKDKRTSYTIRWTPEGTYYGGYEASVRYDSYLKTWTSEVTCNDFWEHVKPQTADDDNIYFSSPQDGLKWAERIMDDLVSGKDRTKIVGFQGINQEARDRAKEKKEAEEAKKREEAGVE